MHLSRVTVATQTLNRHALLNLMAGDAYSNHQLLWRLFTDQPQRNFLFRQEIEQEQLSGASSRGLPLFYVLSTEPPNDVPGLLETQTKPFEPKLNRGDALAFKLRANPTVARKREGHRNSARHDVLMDAKVQCRRDNIITPDEQANPMNSAAIAWLDERAEQAGFQLVSAPQVTGYRQHSVARRDREIRFSSVDYDGLLTVLDPEVFKQTLGCGLGHSRAFGCGLLMIRRA